MTATTAASAAASHREPAICWIVVGIELHPHVRLRIRFDEPKPVRSQAEKPFRPEPVQVAEA